MKKFIITVLTVVSFNVVAKACDNESVGEAEEIVKSISSRVDMGLASNVSLLEAHVHLLKMKQCQRPQDKKICDDFLAAATQLYVGIKQGVEVGVVTTTQLLDAHELVARSKKSCALLE